MTPGLLGYRTLTLLGGPFVPLLLHARVRKGKEDPKRLPERLGIASCPRPAGRLIWLHGASIGESQVLLLLFEALREADPALQAVITTQTLTSSELIARKSHEGLIHQMAPVDTPTSVKRFLRHWQPDLAVFAEGDIWPNMLTRLDQMRIPKILVNARMTEKSLKGWKRFNGMAQILFGGFENILAANQKTADGLRGFTEKPVRMAGNIKYAAPPLPCDADELKHLRAIIGNRPVLAAISTHPGEDGYVHRALENNQTHLPEQALLILVPRHPERGPDIKESLSFGRDNFYLRSEGGKPSPDAPVWICDTLGEVGLWVRLANVVFLGGGLPGSGIFGHNPIEPIKLDRYVMSFPEVDNFKQEFADLVDANAALLVADDRDLAVALGPWLSGEASFAPDPDKLTPYLSGHSAINLARDAALAALELRSMP